MSVAAQVKSALYIVGMIVLGYGMRVDRASLRWIGIAFLVGAFALRFVKPRPEPE